MVYTITPARLNALSPAAQALARAAIELGVWQLVQDKNGGVAPQVGCGAPRDKYTTSMTDANAPAEV